MTNDFDDKFHADLVVIKEFSDKKNDDCSFKFGPTECRQLVVTAIGLVHLSPLPEYINKFYYIDIGKL